MHAAWRGFLEIPDALQGRICLQQNSQKTNTEMDLCVPWPNGFSVSWQNLSPSTVDGFCFECSSMYQSSNPPSLMLGKQSNHQMQAAQLRIVLTDLQPGLWRQIWEEVQALICWLSHSCWDSKNESVQVQFWPAYLSADLVCQTTAGSTEGEKSPLIRVYLSLSAVKKVEFLKANNQRYSYSSAVSALLARKKDLGGGFGCLPSSLSSGGLSENKNDNFRLNCCWIQGIYPCMFGFYIQNGWSPCVQ